MVLPILHRQFARLQVLYHKEIGKRYIVTAFIFFLLAGFSAYSCARNLRGPRTASRSGQVQPDLHHAGTTMMFLFAVPMMFEALSVYFIPLMVGARNIAFPRLNAYSYYLYVFGGIILCVNYRTHQRI